MPSLQVITLPSPTNLIYFDTCFKQQRDASYVISQRVGCIKNVNRIQYFIDVSFMKVTPVSRDCGITLVLKVTLSVVVFSFQRCQRTIIKNEGRPPKNEADVNEKHLFVYLFFTWLNNCSKIELSITVKPPLMDSIYYIKTSLIMESSPHGFMVRLKIENGTQFLPRQSD